VLSTEFLKVDQLVLAARSVELRRPFCPDGEVRYFGEIEGWADGIWTAPCSSPIPLPSHRVDSECRQLWSTCIGKAGDGKCGHPSVRLTQQNSNLPPENVVWRAYKWPRKRDVPSSRRRWNDQIIEVFYTPLVYIIVAPLAFVFWLIQIAHRTKRSQPANKNATPIRR
jgi:hypothetical protein